MEVNITAIAYMLPPGGANTMQGSAFLLPEFNLFFLN